MLNAEALASAGKTAIQRLSAVGIRVNAGARLVKSIEFLEQLDERRRVGDKTLEANPSRIADGITTVLDAYLISHTVGPVIELEPSHRHKLNEFLSGAEIEHDDKNSVARDTQFELLLGTLLAMAGERVHLGEPDLRFEFLGQYIGIAAKKLSAEKQTERRVREAAHQVEGMNEVGLVALNFDRIVRQRRPISTVQPPVVRLRELVKPLFEADRWLAHRPSILGRIVLAREFSLIEGGMSIDTYIDVCATVGKSHAEDKVADELDRVSKRILSAMRLL